MQTKVSVNKQNNFSAESKAQRNRESVVQRKHNVSSNTGLSNLITDSSSSLSNSSNHLSNLVHTSRVQPKLSIGKPNDRLEQEADRVAEKVMTSPAANHHRSLQGQNEEEELQTKPQIQRQEEEEEIQAKLLVQKQEEEELQKWPLIQRQEEEEELQAKSFLQKKEEDEQPEPLLQTQEEEDKIMAKSPAPGVTGSGLLGKVQSAKNGGKALPDSTLSFMESGFGRNFSGVRIHTGPEAVQISQNLGAQAFTHGNDIFFNQNKFSPGTSDGRRLLAHELTHTVQQGASTQRMVQQTRSRTARVPKLVESDDLNEFILKDGTYLNIGSPTSKLDLPLLSLPQFKSRHSDKFKKPVLLRQGDRKKTKQVEHWANEVKSSVHKHIEKKIRSAKRQGGFVKNKNTYFFKSTSGDKFYLFGTPERLLERAVRPFWSKRGKLSSYQVDHIVEDQLLGDDSPENYELLEASANMSSGAKIAAEVRRRIRAGFANIRRAYKENPKLASLPSWIPMEDVKYKYKTRFLNRNFKLKGLKGRPNDFWSLNQIKRGQHLRRVEPLKGQELATLGEQSEPAIFSGPDGGKKLHVPKKLPYDKWLPRVKLLKIDLKDDPSEQDTAGTIQVEAFKADEKTKLKLPNSDNPVMTWNLLPVTGVYGGAIDKKSVAANVKNSLRLPGLSPITLSQVDFHPTRGLIGMGVLRSDIPIISDLEIDIIIAGNDVQFRKEIPTDKLKLPEPLKIETSTLIVFWGRRGLGFEGDASFSITNVGEGRIRGHASTDGHFGLAGTFNFDTDLFTKAEVSVLYENNEWHIEGEIGIDRKNKVKGIKKASIKVSYQTGELQVKGNATTDIRGIKDQELEVELQKDIDGLKIAAKTDIASLIPKLIKKGELSLVFTKDNDGYKLAGDGFAVLDIPGLSGDPELGISYDEGILVFECGVHFEKERAKGEIKVGITNQKVDENKQPTGKATDEWSVFGGGKISIYLSKDVVASVDAMFEPNGDLIVSGEVGVDRSNDITEKIQKEFDHELFKIATPEIILFALPIGASLTVKLVGRANLYGSLQPPRVEQILIRLEGLNLSRPEEESGKAIGRVVLSASANAGLKLIVDLIATLSVLIAKVRGILSGSIGIDAMAKGEASLEARWTRSGGLELTAGNIKLEASAQFLAELQGKIRVFLDLWLTEIDIFEESITIASARFGPTWQVGVNLPITFENEQIKLGELNKDAFDFPDMSSTSKQMEYGEQAVKQDEKLKEPPPPSKEKARRIIRKLPSGSISWGIVDRPLRNDYLFSMDVLTDMNLISRDTYLMWLWKKHGKIDWSDVESISAQRDHLDSERVKAQLVPGDSQSSVELYWSRLVDRRNIKAFAKDHILFAGRSQSQIGSMWSLFDKKYENY
ncbi:MAG: DUF4157 domain-containing protein [Deltaproteobacteria bacterium]|nr:DUF4157 domain-containing protein [Deltaproteobacteria bacterium]